MKTLNVQLQPARTPELEIGGVVAWLQTVAPATISQGEDAGPYINVGFRTADLPALWAKVHELLQSDARMGECAIVCCEGERGWDDFRLLHHFDPTQKLDGI